MQNEQLIATTQFCASHRINISFLRSLEESGLIETTTIEETAFIDQEHLEKLEKIVRLHNDLEINLEGIEVITRLLDEIEQMNNEMTILKNRLRLYDE
jgi:hypothetical protein